MLKRCLPLAIVALLAAPAAAPAVELKNFRVCYAPLPFGATRVDAKCLPGDFLFVTYDIEALKFDDKTGKASFVTVLELFDAQAKEIFKKETPSEVVAHLGGSRMPGDLHVQMGRAQKPGKYRIRLTVLDRLAKSSDSEVYSFELLPPTFGIAGIVAPAIGFPGQHHSTEFALVDLTLDGKKQPDVEVTMRVFDDAGKEVAKPIVSILPRDLPVGADLEKENFVPMRYPIYLNRSGRFTIDIHAKDKAGNKEARLKYPLNVLDFSGGK
ncbi:MAG: hypothetical protein L0Y71_24660 [Gemmataceae bacterium]|nr:hypothetical protein [Gemmataceae bacterium]